MAAAAGTPRWVTPRKALPSRCFAAICWGGLKRSQTPPAAAAHRECPPGKIDGVGFFSEPLAGAVAIYDDWPPILRQCPASSGTASSRSTSAGSAEFMLRAGGPFLSARRTSWCLVLNIRESDVNFFSGEASPHSPVVAAAE